MKTSGTIAEFIVGAITAYSIWSAYTYLSSLNYQVNINIAKQNALQPYLPSYPTYPPGTLPS